MVDSTNSKGDSPTVCPVDPSTRAAWLAAANAKTKPTVPPHPTTADAAASPTSTKTCDSSNMHLSPSHPSDPLPATLSPHREISTIPRAVPTSPGTNPENFQAHTSTSGHWIYPSEQMFFAAMRRKSWDPQAPDMRHIVPIHNAVNERAWSEIKEWEKGRGGEKCGGPKLVSFEGDSARLTPKARLMMLFGYQRPFDRHDWTVERCGKEIHYVIDFYSGRRDPSKPEAVSFYLDVRPKINSVEGVWMRVSKWAGSWF